MTIKELAEFTGKNRTTIERWCAKCTLTIKNKVQNAHKENPADFTIEEVEEILNSGSMSKDAVTILMQNANQSAALVSNDIDYQMIGNMIGMAVAAAMTPIVKQLEMISKPQLQLEQPKQDYFSLLAYCNLKEIKITHSESILHGKALRRICSDNNKELRQIPDERWGRVNSYPIDILEEYFTV